MDFAATLAPMPFLSGSAATAQHAARECVPAPDHPQVTLARRRVAVLKTRGAAEIRCRAGEVWITLPGQLDDVVLRAGQSWRLAHPARDVLLSSAGAHCQAVVEIRPTEEGRGRSHWMQLDFG